MYIKIFKAKTAIILLLSIMFVAAVARTVHIEAVQAGLDKSVQSVSGVIATVINYSFYDTMHKEKEKKPKFMEKQRKLLEKRYVLSGETTKEVTMTRGKPIPVGPTARLKEDYTWSMLAKMTPNQIKIKKAFPYLPLPHPIPETGGQVFPAVQTAKHPVLVRFDVDFDLPNEYLPEFPPALFLTTRPDMGDVSQGKEIVLENYYDMFKDILTPVQLEGLRLLVTKFPQQQFNATDDRKTERPSLGVSCFDCHVNGSTVAQFHLNPDTRPQNKRFRVETVSLRGLYAQQIHGSKRSLRSVEDFTEFEQRSAYFDGDHILAAKKGVNVLSREQVMFMAQLQNIIDFPPAPKLNLYGRLDHKKASRSEIRGEELFFGKARCAECHPAPYYLDNKMHDLKLNRFYGEHAEGPMKTFTLRGLKDTPPYIHDGRCLTIEDTVEFFNLVLGLYLNVQQKKDLTDFLRCL